MGSSSIDWWVGSTCLTWILWSACHFLWYGKFSLVSISEIHPYIDLLYPSFSCVCLVANPSTGDDTWDQWQQQ
jgi:hypothetical protein